MMRGVMRGGGTGVALGAATFLALAGCEQLDIDLRGGPAGTSQAARTPAAPPPEPDARGVVSYPGYKVALARRDETVADIAARLGLSAGVLAELNGIDRDVALRAGEVVALPDGALSGAPAADEPETGGVDITALAESALAADDGGGEAPAAPGKTEAEPGAAQPIRHTVAAGETAYSVARLYDVSVSALAEWNGLGPDLVVREGRTLLIPLPASGADAAAGGGAGEVSEPGRTSPVDTPPSAAEPLPEDDERPAGPEDPAPLASPEMGADDTGGDGYDGASEGFVFPVRGEIIRPFEAGSFEGIDISAPAGAPVSAAEDGTVVIVTEDTEGVTIVAIDHGEDLLSVYANIGAIAVSQGDSVARGQDFAEVAGGDEAFLHFEVRRGMEPLDPAGFF